MGDPALVHEGIARDAESGDDGPTRARLEKRVFTPRAGPPVESEDARPDQDDSRDAQWRQPLVEKQEGRHGHDGDAEPARERVDEGEVTGLIGPGEREEVNAVENHGGDDEGDGAR